jgi:hypothetical protein
MSVPALITFTVAEYRPAGASANAPALFPSSPEGITLSIRPSSNFVSLTQLLQDKYGLMTAGEIDFYTSAAADTPVADLTQSFAALGVSDIVYCALRCAACPHGAACRRYGCRLRHPPARPHDCPDGDACTLPLLLCGRVHPGDWVRALRRRPCRYGRACTRQQTCAYNHDGADTTTALARGVIGDVVSAAAPTAAAVGYAPSAATRAELASSSDSFGGVFPLSTVDSRDFTAPAKPKRAANAAMDTDDASAAAFAPIRALARVSQCPPWATTMGAD